MIPGDDPADRFLADAVIDEAARRRAARHATERRLVRDQTLGGILIDLAERGGPVGVHTVVGPTARGYIAGVGSDCLRLVDEHQRSHLVAMDYVTAIRPAPGQRRSGETREPPRVADLAVALTDLVERRARVTIVTADAEQWVGQLTAVGSDVVTLMSTSPDSPSQPTHVALPAVVTVST